MYHSPYDARALCQKFLKDTTLQQDLVEASNQFIEEHGRWKGNFRRLEEHLNIKLINNNQPATL